MNIFHWICVTSLFVNCRSQDIRYVLEVVFPLHCICCVSGFGAAVKITHGTGNGGGFDSFEKLE